MDLASHAPGEVTNATYDKTDDAYVLRLIHGKSVLRGQEISITYGDEKGACEMLFSYGFIDHAMETAETLFLGLSISADDATATAKTRLADCAPGFKIIDIAPDPAPAVRESASEPADGAGLVAAQVAQVEDVEIPNILDAHDAPTEASDPTVTYQRPSAEVDWKGDFVWLLCVSEDDGLSFQVARTVDGQEEVRATFRDQEFEGANGLRQILAKDELWDVFRLRAIVILQQRVFEQLQVLFETQEKVELEPHGTETQIRAGPHELAMQLRRLEFELLEKAYEGFEAQVSDALPETTRRPAC
jgi:hypothetical protein